MDVKELEEKIAKLQEMIDASKHIVFFGGAGVSTESGVPDFRSEDGLYHQKFDYPPETMLSHSFYVTHKKDFFRFYYDKILVESIEKDGKECPIEPNAAHKKLAELEAAGKLSAVVTQNIDGLHQKAGSKKVLELHGTVMRNYCLKCGAEYGLDFMLDKKHAGDLEPKCPKCGGDVKPDVVLYEESLNMATMEEAVREISTADMLIIGGTSLVVYPAAGMVDYYRGNRLVLINKSSTKEDRNADLIIAAPIGQVLSHIGVRNHS